MYYLANKGQTSVQSNNIEKNKKKFTTPFILYYNEKFDSIQAIPEWKGSIWKICA
jgi:hypothetical protein